MTDPLTSMPCPDCLLRSVSGLLLGLVFSLVQAQPVYRCGQAYTNAPPAGILCERLPEQQVTVIEGTRVQRPSARAPSPAAVSALPAASSAQPAASGPLPVQELPQSVRDGQARSVLLAELERTRERLQGLEQEQRQLQTATASSTATPDAQARAQALEQSVLRTRRDLQSLQRELERLAASGARR